MDHLGVDDDVAGRLKDLRHVVVDGRQIRVSAALVAPPDDAAVADIHVEVAFLEPVLKRRVDMSAAARASFSTGVSSCCTRAGVCHRADR